MKDGKCECGGKTYGYATEKDITNKNMHFYICYKCGRFSGQAYPELTELLVNEPKLILHLINSGYLIPI